MSEMNVKLCVSVSGECESLRVMENSRKICRIWKLPVFRTFDYLNHYR